MIVCTYIYAETNGTKQMRRSVEMNGHELAVCNVHGPDPNAINQQLIQLYQRASTGHETFLYLDAADSFVQREITDIPTDHILYSTEKACYPHPAWANDHPPSASPWRYLNGGGVCGPLKLMIEYYRRYNLANPGSENGQAYLQRRLFEAIKDGFPVKLDTECRIFQTTAFADPSEFEWTINHPYVQSFVTQRAYSVRKGELLMNKITNTFPAVLHGNGLTDMSEIYKRLSI